MDTDLIRLVLVAALAGLAGASDVRRRTIPNRVTAAGLVAGLVLASRGGAPEVGVHLATAAVVFLATLPLFAGRVLGGGDVKLLVAMGLLLGPRLLPAALAIAGLAGAGLALAQAIRKGIILPLLLEAREALAYHATLGRLGVRVEPVAAARLTVPYGVAIGIGAVGACLL